MGEQVRLHVKMESFNLLLFGIDIRWGQKMSVGNKIIDKNKKNVILKLQRRNTYASKSNRKNGIFFVG